MNNLESIVPPLELCKRIPAGKFEDSALLWEEDSYVLGKLPPHVVPRVKNTYHTILAPAPTLAEILDKLRPGHWCLCAIDRWYRSEAGTSAATAALRMWLDVEGVENE